MYHVRTGKQQLGMAPLLQRSKQVLNRRRAVIARCRHAARNRGGTEAALVDALRKGTIAGAGLDVYEGEPQVSSELIAMENVVLLPHLGSATTETRVAMGTTVLDNAEAFFAGETPPNRVA